MILKRYFSDGKRWDYLKESEKNHHWQFAHNINIKALLPGTSSPWLAQQSISFHPSEEGKQKENNFFIFY
jgi:hypothetical protein